MNMETGGLKNAGEKFDLNKYLGKIWLSDNGAMFNVDTYFEEFGKGHEKLDAKALLVAIPDTKQYSGIRSALLEALPNIDLGKYQNKEFSKEDLKAVLLRGFLYTAQDGNNMFDVGGDNTRLEDIKSEEILKFFNEKMGTSFPDIEPHVHPDNKQ